MSAGCGGGGIGILAGQPAGISMHTFGEQRFKLLINSIKVYSENIWILMLGE